ncbi:hypothetical protein AB0M87_08545 [Streptomyces sp. NPDC051320]|uniref:hypothetical protein n=1 Tax=Streptomyces sp. NPDC051320 TaxID=3154644 RepID=UPI003449FAFA
MTTPETEPAENAEPAEDDRVGTRYRSEVEAAYRKSAASAEEPARQTQLARGLLTGYRWALGHSAVAPVTGGATNGPPGLGQLTAEVDAATVQLEGAAQRGVSQDHTQGVYDALAWVCGQLEQRP